MEEILTEKEIILSDYDNQLEWEKQKEEEKNECILKAFKKIKEMVFWVEGTNLDDIERIIRELENEVGEI